VLFHVPPPILRSGVYVRHGEASQYLFYIYKKQKMAMQERDETTKPATLFSECDRPSGESPGFDCIHGQDVIGTSLVV
jgi:hypothetical protein